MSLDAAYAFRDRLNADQTLQSAFADAYAHGPAAMAELARSHGYDVSPDEAATAVARAQDGDELSDHELELVSAGGDPASNIGGARYG